MDIERKAQLYWLGILTIIVILGVFIQDAEKIGKMALIVAVVGFGVYFSIFGGKKGQATEK